MKKTSQLTSQTNRKMLKNMLKNYGKSESKNNSYHACSGTDFHPSIHLLPPFPYLG